MDAGLVARAAAAADEVAEALLARHRELAGDPSLARGSAGLAVALSHLAGEREDCAEAATHCLAEAADALGHVRLTPSLFAGFTGIAWAVAHVGALRGERVEDALRDVDRALLDWVERAQPERHFDLTLGLAGVGVYALERLPDDGERLLRVVVAALASRAERTPEGVVWRTAPALLPPEAQTLFPDGRVDLGVAHGAAGVVAVLAAATAAGEPRAAEILAPAVDALRAADRGPGLRFPEWLPARSDSGRSRLAWCYGDLGIAAALLAAADVASRAEWRRAALDLARDAAVHTLETSGVVDAGLCHGAAGVAHLFGRLARRTADGALAEAAAQWLEHTLRLRRGDGGVGGYLAWEPGPGGEVAWRPEPGLLTGAAGVALALDAAAGAEAGWDRLFLPVARDALRERPSAATTGAAPA